MSETEKNDTITTDETRIYEVGFNLVPTLGEEEIAPVFDVLRGIIESNGGNIISEGLPEEITLAYPMKHDVANKRNVYTSAYFGWIKFEMLPEDIAKVKEGFDGNENVIRFIIVKTVREDTLSKKFAAPKQKHTAPAVSSSEKSTDKKEEAPKEPVSEEEVDKAIEELIA